MMRQPPVFPDISFGEPSNLANLACKLDRINSLEESSAFDCEGLIYRINNSRDTLCHKEKRKIPWVLAQGTPPFYADFRKLLYELSFIKKRLAFRPTSLLAIIHSYFKMKPEISPRAVSVTSRFIVNALNKYNGKNLKLLFWKSRLEFFRKEGLETIIETLLNGQNGSIRKAFSEYYIPCDSHVSIALLKKLACRINCNSTTIRSFLELLKNGPYQYLENEGLSNGKTFSSVIIRECIETVLHNAYENSDNLDISLIDFCFSDVYKPSCNIFQLFNSLPLRIKVTLARWLPYWQLTYVRNCINEIQDKLNKALNSKCLILNDELNELLIHYLSIIARVIDLIKSPVISIATVGTTSSGKSTLVNAIIGRQIAPMNAEEMSVGILSFMHAGKNKLIIKNTNPLECGEWENLKDNQIYEKLKNMMKCYINNKDANESENLKKSIPIAQVETPFDGLDGEKMKFCPPDVNIEICDLPGLKHSRDENNLSIIKKIMKKALCMIILDYQSTDTDNRSRLLEELKDLISTYGSSRDQLIFVLNRIDCRNANDDPLFEKLNELSNDIKTHLNLKEYPLIVPLSSFIIFNLLCRLKKCQEIGNSEDDIRIMAKEEILDMIPKIFKAKFPESIQMKEWRKWYSSFKSKLLKSQQMEKVDISRLLELCGARDLWNELSVHLGLNFFPLVLLSDLNNVIEVHYKLNQSFSLLAIDVKNEAENKSFYDYIEDINKSVKKLEDIISCYTKYS